METQTKIKHPEPIPQQMAVEAVSKPSLSPPEPDTPSEQPDVSSQDSEFTQRFETRDPYAHYEVKTRWRKPTDEEISQMYRVPSVGREVPDPNCSDSDCPSSASKDENDITFKAANDEVPSHSMWYEKGEKDKTKATVVIRPDGTPGFLLERTVGVEEDLMPKLSVAPGAISPGALTPQSGNVRVSRLRKMASRIKLGGTENTRPSSTSSLDTSPEKTPVLAEFPQPPSQVRRISSTSTLIAVQKTNTSSRSSRTESGSVRRISSASTSKRSSPQKPQKLDGCLMLWGVGAGPKAPETRAPSPMPPASSGEDGGAKRVFRNLRPHGHFMLYIKAQGGEGDNPVVITFDGSGPVAGTMQCLVEELLHPLFARPHELNDFFRTLLAGAFDQNRRIMMLINLCERFEDAWNRDDSKERANILHLLEEWIFIHPEDFASTSSANLKSSISTVHDSGTKYLLAMLAELLADVFNRSTPVEMEEIEKMKKHLQSITLLHFVQSEYAKQSIQYRQHAPDVFSESRLIGHRLSLTSSPSIMETLSVQTIAEYLAAVGVILFRHAVTPRNVIAQLGAPESTGDLDRDQDNPLHAYQRRGEMIYHWVTMEILLPSTAAQRANVIAQFIDLVTSLLELGSCETAFNIFQALAYTEERVKSAWAMVPDLQLRAFANDSQIFIHTYDMYVKTHKRPVVEVLSGRLGLQTVVREKWEQAGGAETRPSAELPFKSLDDTASPADEVLSSTVVFAYEIENDATNSPYLRVLGARRVLSHITEARGRAKTPHSFGTLSRKVFAHAAAYGGLCDESGPAFGSFPGTGNFWHRKKPKVAQHLNKEVVSAVEASIAGAWMLTSDTWVESCGESRQDAVRKKAGGLAGWQELREEKRVDEIRRDRMVRRSFTVEDQIEEGSGNGDEDVASPLT